MLTVLASIQKSTDYLEKKGIDSPRINAELLLSNILHCSRLDLYLQYDRPLSEEETNNYRNFIQRRGKYEPLQYILGETEFYGIKFIVDSSVLIPRQETEILIDTILECVDKTSELNILDIGCGCGCISICLLKYLPNATVYAIDNSPEAIESTKINSKIYNLTERVNIYTKDIFDDEQLIGLNEFDIIVSNPPYVSKDGYNSLQKEIILFEPESAVTDFNDGYKFYRRISTLTENLLKKGGKLFFEAGDKKADKVKEIKFEKICSETCLLPDGLIKLKKL